MYILVFTYIVYLVGRGGGTAGIGRRRGGPRGIIALHVFINYHRSP